jgi:D-alanine-D-alanine ligase
MSARGIMRAIDQEKYRVLPIGITKEGRWLASGDPFRALGSGVMGESAPVALLPEPSNWGLMCLSENEEDQLLVASRLAELDVVFPILHGPFGEDGTVQGLLELADVPYVGAGVAASAVGMDKALFKDVMRAHSLPVVHYVVVRRQEWEGHAEDTLDRIEAEIGYNCFVKPSNLGSSVGISKARGRSELRDALDLAARYDRKLLVEAAIDAREIEVSVLGNDLPVCSLPGEVVPSREFYDYAAKYLNGTSQLLIPAPLSAQVTEEVQQLARQAYLAIDCTGMARADFLMDRRSSQIYVSEVNTLPGFTPISMYPKLWEASGISYTELIDRLIQLALERHADKKRSATSYEVPHEG